MSVVIRALIQTDIAAAQALLEQLGYSMTGEECTRRIAAVNSATHHAVMIAEKDGAIVGLLHLYARPALESPPEVIVQAVVVDQMYRSSGIGKKLMEAAERWAHENGYASVALTSSVIRTGAHAFYTELGYESVGTSVMFRKQLAAAG